MKSASIVVDRFYHRDRLFALNDPVANRDDCLVAFHALRERLRERGYALRTDDLQPPETAELALYVEMPSRLPAPPMQARSFLLLFESELIRPDNWDLQRHAAFAKIFTWNDRLVDGRRYFKMNFSHKFPALGAGSAASLALASGFEGRERFCTSIIARKACRHRLELYSHRAQAIQWFERHHPEDFAYFGFGWERPYLPVFWAKVARRLGVLDLLPPKPSPCYQGALAAKFETLRQFRFSVCYENARDIPGYITEKIFDCFFAGTVPIYWGADNVADHIPKDAFVDRREFGGYEELYRYLRGMDEDRYRAYQGAIADFLRSERTRQFRAEHFAESVSAEVTRNATG